MKVSLQSLMIWAHSEEPGIHLPNSVWIKWKKTGSLLNTSSS